MQALDVVDAESYVAMCEHKLAAAAFLKKVDGIIDGIKKAHKAALEAALDPWNRIADPIREAESTAEMKRNDYRRAQERRTLIETARLAAAEAERVKAERAADVAALQQAHLATGDRQFAEAAEVLERAPVHVPAPVAAPVVPKVSGIRNTKKLTLNVPDLRMLIMAVGAALILGEDVEIDPTTLTAIAQGVSPDDFNCLTANLSWLRDCHRQRKERFAFPGVTATYE